MLGRVLGSQPRVGESPGPAGFLLPRSSHGDPGVSSGHPECLGPPGRAGDGAGGGSAFAFEGGGWGGPEPSEGPVMPSPRWQPGDAAVPQFPPQERS